MHRQYGACMWQVNVTFPAADPRSARMAKGQDVATKCAPRSRRHRRLAKRHRSGVCKFNLGTKRMCGNPSDDGSWDIVEIVGGMRIANEYDVETSSQGTANRCTDTHLGQQARDGNARHLLAHKDILKRSPVEAVVPTLAEHQLAWRWRHLRMDTPAGRPWLVKRPRRSIMLQMDDQRTSQPCRRQHHGEAA